jgi:hypothetical protein
VKLPVNELPSNKKFGYFFTILFVLIGLYSLSREENIFGCVLFVIAFLFFLATLLDADILLPLNKLWMSFGALLGTIVNPIVLGLIFFGMVAPMAVAMRLCRRDELRLRFCHKASHWITRSEPIETESFKNQF